MGLISWIKRIFSSNEIDEDSAIIQERLQGEINGDKIKNDLVKERPFERPAVIPNNEKLGQYYADLTGEAREAIKEELSDVANHWNGQEGNYDELIASREEAIGREYTKELGDKEAEELNKNTIF